MERYKEIERSIIKKYRKDIWVKFVECINLYNMIEENDKIMVCISGGKDSFLLAKCLEEIKRHGKFDFDIEYVVMDPGYTKDVRKKIEENAKILNLPIKIFESDVFEVANKLDVDHPCYMCARMRRGFLYSKAKELGCNKIALGHHFDDVIETSLLSILFSSEVKTMMPKLHSTNFPGIELIRPLFMVKEKSIISWAKSNDLEFINCACKFTERVKEEGLDTGKRLFVKNLINELRKSHDGIDDNIFKALDNVDLNCILGTRKDGVYKSFMDDYDK